jgi:hypothetical protein
MSIEIKYLLNYATVKTTLDKFLLMLLSFVCFYGANHKSHFLYSKKIVERKEGTEIENCR